MLSFREVDETTAILEKINKTVVNLRNLLIEKNTTNDPEIQKLRIELHELYEKLGSDELNPFSL